MVWTSCDAKRGAICWKEGGGNGNTRGGGEEGLTVDGWTV